MVVSQVILPTVYIPPKLHFNLEWIYTKPPVPQLIFCLVLNTNSNSLWVSEV